MWYDTIVSNIKTALETIFVKKSDIKDDLTSTDTNKPLSAKQGKNLQDTKQANLVSGTNIKTINNESLLGSGNITIQGGSSTVDIVTTWESTLSDSKVPSEKLTKNTLDNKVNTSDIKDNLTSTDNNKPLSANQGSVLNGKITNAISDLSVLILTKINNHNSDSSAHSTEMAKKLNIAQTSYKGKNVVVDSSSGDITFEDKYSHPSAKQCNAIIPSASSSTPLADVTGGAIGSSSNYAKADHQHPLSSAYATSGHTHTGMLTTSDVANDLTTTSAGKVLDARQGKALKDEIGSIHDLIYGVGN